MKEGLQLGAYRFSLAWTRLLPAGVYIDLTSVHFPGVENYNRLIDALLQNGIVPYVILFHWDSPQVLQDKFGGWLEEDGQHGMVQAFTDYARVAFEAFGDRVKHWITINEPWTAAVNGYGTGVHAPVHFSNPNQTYTVGHHMLLAHAEVVALYRSQFQPTQLGVIGLANSGDYRYPWTDQEKAAAQRAMEFQFGWFTDPIVFGDYPSAMKERLGLLTF